jgi:hypothetical protein
LRCRSRDRQQVQRQLHDRWTSHVPVDADNYTMRRMIINGKKSKNFNL